MMNLLLLTVFLQPERTCVSNIPPKQFILYIHPCAVLIFFDFSMFFEPFLRLLSHSSMRDG